MAIRTSNQITFTEQKKILEIKEWYLATSESADITIETEGWTTDVQTTDATKRYLWNYEEVIYSIGESEKSSPVIIGVYGGVSNIINYYTITEKPIAPDVTSDVWTNDFTSISENLSSTNKYLWNYEIIVYADGSTSEPQPAIIGVYGDSGEDAITFQIYSTEGFEFIDSVNESEKLETITLKLSAFKGTTPLTNAEYTWEWWNSNPITYIEAEVTSETIGDYWVFEDENYILKTLPDEYIDNTIYYVETYSDEGRYEEILTTTDAVFKVNIVDDIYALSNLRCTMILDGDYTNPYYDYVTLSKKVDVYTASIKFFNGTNVFSQNADYLIGYVELYKNNQLEESPMANTYYSGIVTIDSENNIILDKVFDTQETSSYFIYKNTNSNSHNVILGEYNGTNWVVSNKKTKYIYENNVNTNIQSNVFIISKLDITRSRDININVYTDVMTLEEDVMIPDTKKLVAITKTTIIDLNDTIVSNTAPANPIDGQLWFDTAESILKVYNSELGKWIDSSLQNSGQTVYTSQPESYRAGDLWIVEDTRTIISYEKTTVTAETEGIYWILDANQGYISKSLPHEYDSTAVYYVQTETKEKQVITIGGISYGPGSILRATTNSNEYSSAHWEDATPKLTQMQIDIEQYFDFNPQTGLKIGQSNQKFYVNISSTRMSFCEDPNIIVEDETDPYIDKNEVVYIGNRSATIKNLIAEESADFNCEVEVDRQIDIVNTYQTKTSYPGFSLQVEPDGSLSLVVKEVE